jgi:hypothetical protein
MKGFVVVIILLLALPVRPQENWGDAVEGVQLRLGLSSAAAPAGTRAPTMPLLEVQLRNRLILLKLLQFGSGLCHLRMAGIRLDPEFVGMNCSGSGSRIGIPPLKLL